MVSATPKLTASARRELIEREAARLFAKRGFVATTVEEIVAAAGVSKPMLYRHFESKHDLQVKLLERRRDELAAAPLDVFLTHAAEHDRDLPATLTAIIDAWFAHVEANPHTSRMLLQDITDDPQLRELQQELRARQRAADVALLREFAPGAPDEELEPLGEIVRSSLTGLGLWWLEHPEVPRDVVVSAHSRAMLGLLSVIA
jgi:AcrR family transcriptional regulator